SFGAIHQSLFLIQYMPGAKIDPHDHTFEESYLIVSGRVRATADGTSYDLGPGDVIWTGVGCIHSFENAGDQPVRWIETQAPRPTRYCRIEGWLRITAPCNALKPSHRGSPTPRLARSSSKLSG